MVGWRRLDRKGTQSASPTSAILLRSSVFSCTHVSKAIAPKRQKWKTYQRLISVYYQSGLRIISQQWQGGKVARRAVLFGDLGISGLSRCLFGTYMCLPFTPTKIRQFDTDNFQDTFDCLLKRRDGSTTALLISGWV